MKPILLRRGATFVGLILAVTVAYSLGRLEERSSNGIAHAQSGGDALARATRAQPNRDAYFPNSEDLGSDEMRIIACGTGMPSARESQAASCFLVELGNGDKFIFDGGTGSDVRIGSLEIPYGV